MARLHLRMKPAADGGSAEETVPTPVADRLRSNPRDWDSIAATGKQFLVRGQADKALECFHRITREHPEYPGIWTLKASAFEALGDAKNADACRRRGADLPP